MPTISGTPQIGTPLTANTSGIDDANGLDGVSYTYQWICVDSDGTSNATNVGSNSDTYTLETGDEDKKITVKVTFTDDAGYDEMLTNAACPSTGTITGPDNNPAGGAPTISGTVQEGNNLTAATTGITDADGLNNVSYTYQWIWVDSGGSSNPTNVGSNSVTYTLVNGDVGKKLKVQVSFTDDLGNSE